MIVVRRGFGATSVRTGEEISGEKLFVDEEGDWVAWQEVIGQEQTGAVLGEPLPVKELKKRLKELLGSAWTERWRKAPPKQQPVKHPNKEYLKGGHNSVYRLLQEAKLAKQQPAQRSARGPTAKKSNRPKPAGAGGRRC